MEQGFIKIFRQFLDWEWYQDTNVKILFLHCLLKANYKAKKWQGVTIEVGSFITSLAILATELKLSVQQVRTALNKLKSTGEITSKSTNEYTLISITNWASFQDNQQAEQQTDNKQITNEQQTDNNNLRIKELKKERIKENIKAVNALHPDGSKAENAKSAKKTFFCHKDEAETVEVPDCFTKHYLLMKSKNNELVSFIKKENWQAWVDLYGQEWLVEEVKKARAWLLNNANRMPLDVHKFLHNWLAKGWSWQAKNDKNIVQTNKTNKYEFKTSDQRQEEWEAEQRRQFIAGEV